MQPSNSYHTLLVPILHFDTPLACDAVCLCPGGSNKDRSCRCEERSPPWNAADAAAHNATFAVAIRDAPPSEFDFVGAAESPSLA